MDKITLGFMCVSNVEIVLKNYGVLRGSGARHHRSCEVHKSMRHFLNFMRWQVASSMVFSHPLGDRACAIATWVVG